MQKSTKIGIVVAAAIGQMMLTAVAPVYATGTVYTGDSSPHGGYTYYTSVNKNLTIYDIKNEGYGIVSRQVYADDGTGTCFDYQGYNTSITCNQNRSTRGLFLFNACLENNQGATVFSCSSYKQDTI